MFLNSGSRNCLIMVLKGALIRDPKSTKIYFIKKPLHTYKAFLIIAITESFFLKKSRLSLHLVS